MWILEFRESYRFLYDADRLYYQEDKILSKKRKRHCLTQGRVLTRCLLTPLNTPKEHLFPELLSEYLQEMTSPIIKYVDKNGPWHAVRVPDNHYWAPKCFRVLYHLFRIEGKDTERWKSENCSKDGKREETITIEDGMLGYFMPVLLEFKSLKFWPSACKIPVIGC